VQIQRVGYRMVRDGPLALIAGEEREAIYRLAAVAVELEAIEVEAQRVAGKAMLARVGFYDRQKSDFGRFITRERIEERRARRFTDLLRAIPGVRINPVGGGLGRSAVQLRGSMQSYGGVCEPRVFIDGTIVIRGDSRPRPRREPAREDNLATEVERAEFERDEIAIDDVVMPDDIEAIEVYRSAAQTPARFGGASLETQCGVIVIWTRRGGQERR
jgi:outer membrane receptor for ferrienterochelin and colicin